MPYPYSLEDAKKHIKKCMKEQKEKPRKSYSFGIFLKSEKKVVGMIGLFRVNRAHKKTGIGYWIGRKYRNLGFVSEAEKTILDFAFNRLKLNKIKGEAMVENEGSNALFKKFGFRKIGIGKDELIKNGKKKDVYIWELLKSNYKK
jgi:RimJ/RimL family protein N-acetyltransferase